MCICQAEAGDFCEFKDSLIYIARSCLKYCVCVLGERCVCLCMECWYLVKSEVLNFTGVKIIPSVSAGS